MKRVFAYFLVICTLLCACGTVDADPEEELFWQETEEEPAPSLERALPADFTLPYLASEPLNPLTCPDGMQRTVASLLYEGLFRLDGAFEPQALLCASYTCDEDALVYTFTLRDGVVFSDGAALTAADARDTLLYAKTAARYENRLRAVQSVRAQGNVLTVTLSEPDRALPALLDIPILRSGTQSADVPVGTGPYFYDASDAPCLIANESWWQGASRPAERIALTETADEEAAFYRFASHEIHLLVSDLTASAPVSSALSSSTGYAEADSAVMQYLGVNASRPALGSDALRVCLLRGIDRAHLVGALLSGHAREAFFPLSPVSPLYPRDLESPLSSADFARAVAALEEKPARTLRLLVSEENPFRVSAAEYLAELFTSAGIETEAVALPWQDYLSALSRGDFDLYLGEVRLTADWDLTPLLGTGGSLNYGLWSDGDCDTLLAVCRRSADRPTAFRALCAYLLRRAPILPLCFKSVSVLYDADVLGGLSPTASEPFYDLPSLTFRLADKP
ncbi:MAG: hypothetical protein IKN53_02735 [Oscillibacter sp.]|nr:hypothetical protein [Oscillibacter sp.]